MKRTAEVKGKERSLPANQRTDRKEAKREGKIGASSVQPQPNTFELSGAYMKISYASTSFTGRPTLRYEDAAGALDFSGDKIQRVDTVIGRLITVRTDQVHGTTIPGATITVIIPTFSSEKDVSFATKAIITSPPPAADEAELSRGALLNRPGFRGGRWV